MGNSSFDLVRQTESTDSKIVVALERVAAAFRVLLWNESKETALSPIQIQILIFLLFHSHEKCKISYLANEFNMTKATISDSVKVLLQKELVQKVEDDSDTRSFGIKLTKEGKRIAQKAASFAAAIEKPISGLMKEQKEAILSGLLKLIYELNQQGVITIQRMCFTCLHHEEHNGLHYCKLLKTKLKDTDIRIDCSEHEMMEA
jgi:DNA-binding MarR family transcriptional regulator